MFDFPVIIGDWFNKTGHSNVQVVYIRVKGNASGGGKAYTKNTNGYKFILEA